MLNVFSLACCLAGTHLVASWGRRPTALVSQALLTICLFIISGLSKLYADNPTGASPALIYGNVAVIFLFQGFYSVAWTPLLYLYPSEIMNYSIRANGFALSAFALNAVAYVTRSKYLSELERGIDYLHFWDFRLVLVFLEPIGITNIGWKMYIINAGWDVIILFLIVSLLSVMFFRVISRDLRTS